MKISRKTYAASISVFSNISLIILKVIIGRLSGSVAIMSEAIHSSIDLLAACIAWLAVAISAQPADTNHPYGHGKFENLSGMIEALLIFVAALWIIHEAINKLFISPPIVKLDLGIIVMGLSVVINILVSNYLMKVGKETDSIALTADAWHLRTDVYTSLGVMGSLIIVLASQYFFPRINLNWLDPIAGIMVAILIMHASYKLIKQASYDLVDVSLPDHEVQWVRDYINSLAPMISGFHGLRTRKAGSYRFIELHIIVDGSITIQISHEIVKKIKQAVMQHFPQSYIVIQVEPLNK